MQVFKGMNLFGFVCFLSLCFGKIDVKAQAAIPYRWNNVPMGGGGFVSGIITSKTQRGLMYARTDVGGAYRWDATNSKWIPLLDWVSENETGYLGVESVASDPSNPGNLYMLVGTSYFNGGKTAILRSSNYGSTFSITDVTSQFKAHGNGDGRNTGEKLAVDPKNGSILYCGTRYNGLFKSTNSGANWSRLVGLNVTTTPSGNGISFVVLDSTGSAGPATQILIVGISRRGTTNLYRSNDGGTTFNAISGAPTNLMPERAVLANDRNLYIAYADTVGPGYASTGQIRKYNVVSSLWTNITPTGITLPFCGISVDPNNSNRVVASTTNVWWSQPTPQGGYEYGDRIFLSTNGGTSWTDVIARGYRYDPNGITWNTFGKIHWAGSIEFDPFNTKKAYIISGNGLFMTENIDSTINVWKFNVKGLEETVPMDVVSIPEGPLISVIGDYDGFRNIDVTQYGPQLNPAMGTTTGLAYAALSTNVVVRAGAKMYYSTNTGQSWTQCTTKGSNGYVSISADGNTFLHSPGGLSITYRSTNKGTSWSAVSGLSIADARTVADPVNSNKFYAYNTSSGVMWVSTNGGLSFSASGSPGSSGSKHIRTVLGYEGHIWVALYNGGLTRSANSGKNFTKIANVTTCSAVGVGKKGPGAGYPTIYIWGTIGGVTGIYRTTDQGATWVRINDNAHEYGGPGNGQFVIGDMNVYGRVYMSTVGRGIAYGEPMYDCFGDSAGAAFYDNCGVCVGGNTGNVPCLDCNGVSNGTAFKDSCNLCVGGNTGLKACVKDCKGDWGGTANLDSCKTCVGGNTGLVACIKDCNGVWGGTANLDSCQICVGGNTGKVACIWDAVNVGKGKTFSYAPNPFENSFHLQVTDPSGYKIFNITGALVDSGYCEKSCYIGANLNPGIYSLTIRNQYEIKTVKIIKQ